MGDIVLRNIGKIELNNSKLKWDMAKKKAIKLKGKNGT